ncbi:MAG TPA: hypothetical protein VGP80_16795 [Gemmatimonadales bacterium]|jgi:hypothetical protein|nr:hypothetical protein [Gemmatimonadales bacterium]
MKLTLTPDMLAALDRATDKPDWLIERLADLKQATGPCVLTLKNEESTALEELCAMNIRFDESGNVIPEHQPLDALSIMIMDAY